MKTILALLLLIPSLSWGEKSNEEYANEVIDLAIEIKEKNLNFKRLEKKCNRIELILQEKKPRYGHLTAEIIKKYDKHLRLFWTKDSFCREVQHQNVLNEIKVNRNFKTYEFCLGVQDKPEDDKFRKQTNAYFRELSFCEEVIDLAKQVKYEIFQEREVIDEKRKRFSNKCFRENLKDGLSDMAVNMILNTCIEDAEAKYPYKN